MVFVDQLHVGEDFARTVRRKHKKCFFDRFERVAIFLDMLSSGKADAYGTIKSNTGGYGS
jgi:hypothetical protein